MNSVAASTPVEEAQGAPVSARILLDRGDEAKHKPDPEDVSERTQEDRETLSAR